MKSNVYKIGKSTKELDAILKESEKVAGYNGLTHKQTLQLRLLCEEVGGMLPNIIDNYEGDFWIECDKNIYKVNVSIKIPEFTIEKKGELINLAKDKKNAAAVGIVGKIRSALENFMLNEEKCAAIDVSPASIYMSTGYGECIDYSYFWSLENYRSTVNKEETYEAWDELEKSVIASVADDVIVGVKGKRANIVIVKNFA